ncbi:helix-turn-helix transcriptional regulator [Flavobacterium jejuense]|uniref:Helix-turn-helix transcriptional regulator n=1 Tax=Flavobacterium jejuense TaxID=1544455 RepID=A0ABX0IXV3_9FLAO|nr:helix-turn-helix transcriptional regulator [Flavobacterium jejuense]NHN27373.1 helix-turn-helix transcriptional regulator [Flavobacterium jejuense]
MSVGTKIRKLRLQHKMSQEDLAHKLNVAQTSISNIEANKSIPDFLIMHKICQVFEVDFEYFIDKNNSNKVKKAEYSNIGCTNGTINTIPEGILENMLKRIEDIEKIIVVK